MKALSQMEAITVRIAHLTTVDMSLALLLSTELDEDVEAGHTVFGISAGGPYVDRVEDLGVTHVSVNSLTRSWNLRRDLRAFLELIRTLRELKLDVLHTHTPKAGVMGRIAGRLAGVPVVVNTCHGLWAGPEDARLKRTFVYGIEALAIRFSDYEFFQNAEDAHTMRRFLKKNRWKVVGNGVDLERFQHDTEGRARVRAEWGIRDDQMVVGTIGRRVREKGLAEFAAAAHRLGDRAVFIWVGPEDDTDAATNVPHQEAVRFVGERSDMPAVYSALDIFALGSYREGFSRASMEAAACGLPLVLTNIRGCREIGTDGEQVILVEPKDADSLTRGIRLLLDDTNSRSRLGAKARERATNEFDQRLVAQESLNAYKTAASRDQPAAEILRVLHVLPEDRDRGAQIYAGRLRDHLNATTPHEHTIVTLFKGPDAAMRADVKLAVKGGLLRKAGLSPKAATALRRTLARIRPDVVVAHGGEALKYVVAAGGAPTTVYKRTGLSSAEIARPSRRALYKFLAHRVTHTVGVATSLLDQSSQLFNVPRATMTLIPNSRDPEIYHPHGSGPAHGSPPVVTFIGQLEEGKRPVLFLDVVQLLRRREVVFDAVFVGDGPMRDNLQQRAMELGTEMWGVRSDVPDILRRTAVLVMTSTPGSEGMPGVLIEAGLSGVPVVSTDASGVADVIAAGETGYISRSDTADELADFVELLINDPAKRVTMGAAARTRCFEHFTFDSTAAQWHELLVCLATQRGKIGRKMAQNERVSL